MKTALVIIGGVALLVVGVWLFDVFLGYISDLDD